MHLLWFNFPEFINSTCRKQFWSLSFRTCGKPILGVYIVFTSALFFPRQNMQSNRHAWNFLGFCRLEKHNLVYTPGTLHVILFFLIITHPTMVLFMPPWNFFRVELKDSFVLNHWIPLGWMERLDSSLLNSASIELRQQRKKTTTVGSDEDHFELFPALLEFLLKSPISLNSELNSFRCFELFQIELNHLATLFFWHSANTSSPKS